MQQGAATEFQRGMGLTPTYYFCAKICKEKFDKDPEKILKKEKQ
jgi:YHS domain-containing protein